MKILASVLRTDLENHNAGVQKQVRDYFTRIVSTEVQDEGYIKDTSLDFCKKQKLKEALMQSVDLIQNSLKNNYEKKI